VGIELRPYQTATIKKGLELGNLGIFSDTGTGKTICTIGIARMLKAKRLLVVAPLSVVSVWEDEVERYWPGALFVDGTVGTQKERSALVRNLREVEEPVVLVVGYETYWREPLRTAVRATGWDVVAMDEAHRIKNRSAKQAMFAHLLGKDSPHRIAMTATPIPQGPQDAFSIFRFIEPRLYGERWVDFRMHYLQMGGYYNRQIVGYYNLPEFETKLHAYSVRVSKKEALDLPKEQPVSIRFHLNKKTRAMYDEMRDEALAEIESLDGRTQGVAISRIALTTSLRLQQMTSGFSKDEDTGNELDIGTEKLDILMDLLSDRPQRAVVFALYRRDVERIEAAVRAEKRPVWVLDGRANNKVREERRLEWVESTDGVLVCQIAVASAGINLSAAAIDFFYSYDNNLVNWSQSHGRLNRPGQTLPVTHYYLSARDTVDEKVIRSNLRKENLSATVLDKSAARELLV